jgi:hypothetical protein
MSKVTEFLEKFYVKEDFSIEGGGIGKLPPMRREEEEIEDQPSYNSGSRSQTKK